MSNYSSSKFKEDFNTPWFKVFNMIEQGSKVLDIGCSSGNFGYELIKKRDCTVDGVEINQSDVLLAQKKLRSVYTFNVEEGVPDELRGKYDVVYFGDVIEHLVHPVAALGYAKDLLKENGSLVFSIPNMAHISVRMMLLEGDFEYGGTGLLDNTHLHYYTRNEVERVLNEAGYSIQKLDWVKRDMPKDILNNRLKELGLTANEKFIKMTKGVDAAAYQYIGLAKYTGKPKRLSRPKVSPAINEMEKHITSLNEEHRAEIERVKAHYENLLKESEVKYERRVRTSLPLPTRSRIKNLLKKREGK